MKRLHVPAVGFVQASALAVYITLVGLLMQNSQSWSNQTPGVLGILFFLIIFATSALVSGLITLGYPAYILFKYKDAPTALRLVISTAGWLGLLIATLALLLFR